MIYTVLGIFDSIPTSEQVLLHAQEAGFSLERISVIFRVASHTHPTLERLIYTDSITVPSSGAITIGGPFMASFGLIGATRATITDAATGLVAGGIAGALVGLGVAKAHAVTIDHHLSKGNILLGLPATDEQIPFIRQVFSEHGCLQSFVMKTPTHQYPYLLSSLLFEYQHPDKNQLPLVVGTKGGKQSNSRATKKRVKRT